MSGERAIYYLRFSILDCAAPAGCFCNQGAGTGGVWGAVAEEYAIGLSCQYVLCGGVCGHDVDFAAVRAIHSEKKSCVVIGGFRGFGGIGAAVM